MCSFGRDGAPNTSSNAATAKGSVADRNKKSTKCSKIQNLIKAVPDKNHWRRQRDELPEGRLNHVERPH